MYKIQKFCPVIPDAKWFDYETGFSSFHAANDRAYDLYIEEKRRYHNIPEELDRFRVVSEAYDK